MLLSVDPIRGSPASPQGAGSAAHSSCCCWKHTGLNSKPWDTVLGGWGVEVTLRPNEGPSGCRLPVTGGPPAGATTSGAANR